MVTSFIILRLFAFKVEPVEVISVINSEEPVDGCNTIPVKERT